MSALRCVIVCFITSMAKLKKHKNVEETIGFFILISGCYGACKNADLYIEGKRIKKVQKLFFINCNFLNNRKPEI